MSKHVRELSPGATSSFGFATHCCALAWLNNLKVWVRLGALLHAKKSVHFPSPCAQIEEVRVTPNHKTTKVRKNRLRRETVVRPEFTCLRTKITQRTGAASRRRRSYGFLSKITYCKTSLLYSAPAPVLWLKYKTNPPIWIPAHSHVTPFLSG